MNVNVIDVEATCWDDARASFSRAPEDQRQEIIEIGLAVVSMTDHDVTNTHQIYVHNTDSYISEFCTELTGITQADLHTHGTSFKRACQTLRDMYNSRACPFVSWGDFDRRQFKRDCEAKDVAYPFDRHVNLKTVEAIDARRSEQPLQTALDKRGLDFEGRPHAAEDDAYNTARLFLDVFA